MFAKTQKRYRSCRTIAAALSSAVLFASAALADDPTVCSVAGPCPISGGPPGAVFTSDVGCNKINGNIYATKQDVYLNGGPSAANRLNGCYYVRVLSPEGTIRGTSPGLVAFSSAGCLQLWAVVVKSSDSNIGYDDTDNNGGEYKVEVSCDPTFRSADEKSDNFKVRNSVQCSTGSVCISCPVNIEVPCDGRLFGTCPTVTWEDPIVTGGSGTATCSPASGSPFCVGEHDVICTVDGSPEITCTFKVTVDACPQECALPPLDNVPASSCICSADSTSTIAVNYTAPGTLTDDHGITFTLVANSCSPASGSAFTIGTHPVLCTYRDAAGDECTTGFSVIVSADTTPPSITCPSPITVTAGACSTSAKVTFTVTASDACSGTLTPTCTPASGSTFSLGTTTVNCQVADSCQNPNSCSFTVTVTETTSAGCGGLTMGFWQNKNGQGIITASGPKTGTAALTGWLRQFNPFQDLAATSTASQVATYVYNTIKSATAGGAAMNAMLKAQMLATALNVYFSDPALGGNKIGAAKALGGVKLDLTMVCKPIDSSGGSASCSGTYENTSAAFNLPANGCGQGTGALGTCASVSNLLTVASSAATAATTSNVLASPWYCQNKSIQELAKDTFDAFNNGFTFVCGP